LIAERASSVAATSGILHQACITGSESLQRSITEADFKLARKNNDPLPVWGRMPIEKFLGRKLL
jgi:hypothetical protein